MKDGKTIDEEPKQYSPFARPKDTKKHLETRIENAMYDESPFLYHEKLAKEFAKVEALRVDKLIGAVHSHRRVRQRQE